MQVHRKNNEEHRVLYTHQTSVVDTTTTQSVIRNGGSSFTSRPLLSLLHTNIISFITMLMFLTLDHSAGLYFPRISPGSVPCMNTTTVSWMPNQTRRTNRHVQARMRSQICTLFSTHIVPSCVSCYYRRSHVLCSRNLVISIMYMHF